MRGLDLEQQELFYSGSLEQRIPADDPLRAIRAIVDEALEQLDEHFEGALGPGKAAVDRAGAAAAGAAADAVVPDRDRRLWWKVGVPKVARAKRCGLSVSPRPLCHRP